VRDDELLTTDGRTLGFTDHGQPQFMLVDLEAVR
jgi:hypothetical protein